MAESRYISSGRLKPLLLYCAVAFAVVVLLGWMVPVGRPRNLAVVLWWVLFPVGGWLVFKRG